MRDAVTTRATTEHSRYAASVDPAHAAAAAGHPPVTRQADRTQRTAVGADRNQRQSVAGDRADDRMLVGVLRRTVGADADWLHRLERAIDHSATGRSSKADRELVSGLRAATRHLRRADDKLGTAIRDSVECHLTLATRLLAEQPSGGTAQRALAQAVGDIAQLAGWVAFDAGDYQVAENHYRTGLRAAHIAGDHLLSAYLVAHTAHLLANLGETGEALAATAIIRRLTARRTTPATQAYAAAVEADIHARRDDREQALRALDRAERWLGRIVESKEPSWLYFFDRAELLGWRGEVAMRLDLPLMGCEALQERLRLLDASLARERAFATADLACARVQLRHLEEGIALAVDALDRGRAIGSARVVERVSAIRRRLEPYVTAKCVRQLDERLYLDRKTA